MAQPTVRFARGPSKRTTIGLSDRRRQIARRPRLSNLVTVGWDYWTQRGRLRESCGANHDRRLEGENPPSRFSERSCLFSAVEFPGLV